jgi:hypothetical protein
VFEQQLGQRIIERQLGQHFFVGRRAAGGGFFLDRQAELGEQDVAELLRRGQVEGLAGQVMGLRFEGHDLLAHLVALPGQHSPSIRMPVRSICQITCRTGISMSW